MKHRYDYKKKKKKRKNGKEAEIKKKNMKKSHLWLVSVWVTNRKTSYGCIDMRVVGPASHQQPGR